MNSSLKYDPEDIESLLMNKQFHELYPEEKEFVLRHVENADEYEGLRHTLFLMHDIADSDEWLEPDPSIRHNLLQEFAQEERGGFRIWLNSLFAMPSMPEVSWHRRPAVRYALAMCVVLIGISGVIFLWNGQNSQLAENAPETVTQDSAKEDVPAYAENLQPNVFPPAPQPVEEPAGATTYAFTPPVEEEVDAMYHSITRSTDAGSESNTAPPAFLSATSDDGVSLESASEEVVMDYKSEDLARKEPATAEKKNLEFAKVVEKDKYVATSPDTINQVTTSQLGTITAADAGYSGDMHSNVSVMSSVVSESLADGFFVATVQPVLSSSAADMRNVLDLLFTAK